MTVDWSDCYLRHYDRFLRPPVEISTFTGSRSQGDISIMAHDNVFEGCRVFTSLGVTKFSEQLKATGEVFTIAEDGWEEIPYILANTIFFMVESSISLGWGVSIAGIEAVEKSFESKYSKSAVYFTLPMGLPEEFNSVLCSGYTGNVYMCTFISENEHEYFVKHGANSLEKLFENMSVDPFDLNRPSCI